MLSIRTLWTLMLAALAVATLAAPLSAEAPTLTPGNGFTEATPMPAPVGQADQPGYGAQVIGRWDVVPFQTFDGRFETGIVAFHINGVDRVEFSVEGGPWTAVREMTINPRTGVCEYWAVLDAAKFAKEKQGPIEVRAIAYPNSAGQPRLFAAGGGDNGAKDLSEKALHLSVDKGTLPHPAAWVNPDGGIDPTDDAGRIARVGNRDTPFGTIGCALKAVALTNQQHHGQALADGGVVNLEAGDYLYAEDNGNLHVAFKDRWLTIQAAEGVARERVRFVGLKGSGRSYSNGDSLIHVRGVSARKTAAEGDRAGSRVFRGNSDHRADRLWIDHVAIHGNSRKAGSSPFFKLTEVYATDSSITEVTNAFGGWARNLSVSQVGSDALSGSRFIVNSSVDTIDRPEGTGYHPDLLQYTGSGYANRIIYGLRATNIVGHQAIFLTHHRGDEPFKDFAFVNMIGDGKHYSVGVNINHCLFWHCTLTRGYLAFQNEKNKKEHVSVRNCYLNRATHNPGVIDFRADNNHYRTEKTWSGIAYYTEDARRTIGGTVEEIFVDAEAKDFTPAAGSPLLNRVTEALVPVDINNRPVTVGGAIGAVQPPKTEKTSAPTDKTPATPTDKKQPTP